jgi:hypothetical protein
MVNASHSMADTARAELDRRGTFLPVMEVSNHAIDRASTSCLELWIQTRDGPKEGIASWLHRRALEAIKEPKDKKGRRKYGGMVWAFEAGSDWPVLKTVFPVGHRN